MQYLAEKHAAAATHIHDRGQTLEWKSREYRFGRQARERSHTGIHDRLQFRVLRIVRKWILLAKDVTEGCTSRADGFRQAAPTLEEMVPREQQHRVANGIGRIREKRAAQVCERETIRFHFRDDVE